MVCKQRKAGDAHTGILDHCKDASDQMPGDSQDLSQDGCGYTSHNHATATDSCSSSDSTHTHHTTDCMMVC